MYGAILRQETELTRRGLADIGVLFMTNNEYSTMCGHATIALGRFLVDTHDLDVFPARESLQFNSTRRTILLRLHAPCGLLEVTVPASQDGQRSDASRPVSFKSIPCFTTALDLRVNLNLENTWPELGPRISIVADFAYGGAFFCLVSAAELGFPEGLTKFNFEAMNQATRRLKAAVNSDPYLAYLFRHPESNDLSFLYSVIVVDKHLGLAIGNSKGAETGLCFFSDQEVDRSPTGSGVSARLAAAYARGDLKENESWTYHSLVSLHNDKSSAFVGRVLGRDTASDSGRFPAVRTQIEGRAFYTGYHTFVFESPDPLGDGGFIMKDFADSAVPKSS